MTLDELEDLAGHLVSLPGSSTSIDNALLAEYRSNGGTLQERYNLLAQIWASAGQTAQRRALTGYVTEFPSRTLVNIDSDPLALPADSRVFLSYSRPEVRREHDVGGGGGIPDLPEGFGSGSPTPDIDLTPNFGSGSPTPDINIADEIFQNQRDERNEELQAALDALRENEGADIADLNARLSAAIEEYNLQLRELDFGLATTGLDGPLSQTQGAIGSGFRRSRRNQAVTAAGFGRRRLELSHQETLRSISAARRNVTNEYERQRIEVFERFGGQFADANVEDDFEGIGQ